MTAPGGSRYPNPTPWDGDPAQVAEEARALLRMDPSDPDVIDRLVPLSWAASDLVKLHLAAVVPFDDVNAPAEVPEPIHQACIAVVLDAYRRKDTSFGITGAWSNDGINLRVSRDWLDPVLLVLQPYRERFGVG